MNTNISMENLRSLIAVVENGSMLRARESVCLSQSAISLQIKRLEETVGRPLFLRDGKRLTLTRAGRTLEAYARRILALNDESLRALTRVDEASALDVGLVEDFLEVAGTAALSAFALAHPTVRLRLHVEPSRELFTRVGRGELDLALGFGTANDAATVCVSPLVWRGDPALAARPVLPLAVLAGECPFRDAALSALEREGRAFTIAAEAPNLAALRVLVCAGIGLTCRLGETGLSTQGRSTLPSLPPLTVSLAVRRDSPPAVGFLADRLRQALSQGRAGEFCARPSRVGPTVATPSTPQHPPAL